jgi:hypothetical protein
MKCYIISLVTNLSTIPLQKEMYQHSVSAASWIHEANYMGNKTGHEHFIHFPVHYDDEIVVGTKYIENIV